MGDIFTNWYLNHYPHFEADRDIKPFLNVPICTSWIRTAREAQFLSVTSVSSRLGISRNGFRKMEAGELKGTITLTRLKRCAEAMDCELVYAIRPKNRLPFSIGVWVVIMAALGDRVSAHLICKKMFDLNFRRAHGWRNNDSEKAFEYARLLKANRDLSYGRATLRNSSKAKFI